MENTPVKDRTYVYLGSELEVVLVGFYLGCGIFLAGALIAVIVGGAAMVLGLV